MQKFGLERSKSGVANAIELEIAKEQASALGRAGRKLEDSLQAYNRFLSQRTPQVGEDVLIKRISNNVWELMLQRELVGFNKENLQWIRENYRIPERVFEQLGR